MSLEEAIERRGLKERPMSTMELERRGGRGNWAMFSFDLQLKRNVGKSPILLSTRDIEFAVGTVGARAPECWVVDGPGIQVVEKVGYEITQIKYADDGLVDTITLEWVGEDERWGSSIPSFEEGLGKPLYAIRTDTRHNIKMIHLMDCAFVKRRKGSKVGIWETGLTHYDVRDIVSRGEYRWCSKCSPHRDYKLYTYRCNCVEEFRKHGRVADIEEKRYPLGYL
jgi:hypothetical protein